MLSKEYLNVKMRQMNREWDKERDQIRCCREEMQDEKLDSAWKSGQIRDALYDLTRKYKIGYVRDMLVYTVRFQAEVGIVYSDDILDWAIQTKPQLPEPECGTWAIDLNPMLVYDAVEWVRCFEDALDNYELSAILNRQLRKELEIINSL